MGKTRVLKNSFLYVFSSVLLKAFNFFLLPLYTAYLTTKDYGTINLISSFTSVASILAVFAIYYAIVRFYADYKADEEKVRRYFGTLMAFIFLAGVVFSLVISLFNQFFVPLFFKNLNFYPTILIALVSLVFGCLYTAYQHILNGVENAKKYSITSISYFFLQLGLNILFIVGFHMGANGVLLSALISNVVFTIYILFDLRRNNLITFCFDWPLLKDSLKYSLPLLPHNLSTNITSLVSNVFINNSFSLTSVGLFGLATQFGSLADTIQSSVNTAFRPWFFDRMNTKKDKYKDDILDLSNVLMRVYGIFFLLLALFAQEAILLLANENFYKAWTAVPLIVMTYSIKTMYYFYINILFYYKKASKYIFIATLSSSLINIALSALFIPLFDMYGSILADAITMAIRVAIIASLSKHFDDIGYKITTFISLAIFDIAFICLGLIFSYTRFVYEFSWINILYKFLIVFIYVIIVTRPYKSKLRELYGSVKSGIKRNFEKE